MLQAFDGFGSTIVNTPSPTRRALTEFHAPDAVSAAADQDREDHGGQQYRAHDFRARPFTAAGVPILTTTMNGADSFDGSGSSTQGNSLAGSLTVTVMEVQPTAIWSSRARRP